MKRLILLAACLLMACTTSAQEAEIVVSPSGMWLGDAVSVECWFSKDPGADAWAVITEPISLELTGFSRENGSHFSRSYTPPVIGSYTIRCTNGSMDSPEAGFSVAELEAEIEGLPGCAFNDQGMEIHAVVTKNDGSAVHLTSGVDFSVTLDGKGLEIPELPYYANQDGYWVIRTGGMEGFGPGNYNLALEASYQGRAAGDYAQLDVMEPLEFSIESVSPEELHGGENVTVVLRALYHNSSVLLASDISAELDGESLPIERTASGFRFACPELEPEPHSLGAGLEYQGLMVSDSRPVHYMIPVHGEIRNAEGSGVSASMVFTGEGWQKSIRTNVNGAFDVSVPAGVYGLDISFPSSVHVSVKGLDIHQELDDFVRFDSFPSGDIDGIRIAAAFALEFSPGFESMVVKAGYDGSAVGDESDMMVYICEDWNLDSRSCSGSWDEIDFDIDAMQNEVEFKVEHLSGFLIGRRGELSMEASINREEYVTGQSIELTGVVRDESRRVVHDARVEYIIPGVQKGHVDTNTNGIFSASIPVPSEGGQYNLKAEVSKGLYRQDSESFSFTVASLKDFKVIPPLRVDTSEGSESSPEVLIVNTGQDMLKDFRIRLSGIPEEWYGAAPEEWESLMPEEEIVITLIIRPESPEQEIYTIGIDVECDQLSKSESFVMYVKPLEAEEAEAVETNASGSGSPYPVDSVTIYLVGSHEAVLNTLSLIASAGIILIIARRLRSGRRSGSRAWLISLLNAIKSEVIRDPGRPARARPGRKASRKPARASGKHAGRPSGNTRKYAGVKRRSGSQIEIEV